MEPSEYDNIARLEGRHWWYVGMRQIAAGIVAQICPPGPPGGPAPACRILDAGCGVGGGLRWLADFGQVTGIDLHPLAIQYSARVSRRVGQASVQALPFADASFDLVTTFEVLYHLAVSDDAAALNEMRRVLRSGGWLLVRLPAHDWLRGAHDRHVHTRHRYEASELRGKIEAAGFELQRLTSVGLLMLLPAVMLRGAQAGEQTGTDVTMPSAAVNRLLLAGLQLEGKWLRRFDLPAGLSLLALARKP
jgi:SAM-dependent methyltransferase